MSGKLTQERLKELLHYDPDTGIFTWKIKVGKRIQPGVQAGSMGGNHLNITIGGTSFSVRGLAFLYMTGKFSFHSIRHRDGNKLNNSWLNLEELRTSRNPVEKITQKRLKELFHYNPRTGIFTNRIYRSSSSLKGQEIHRTVGYVGLVVDGKSILAHRAAILYTDGYLPEGFVDHIDRNPNNNRRDNLREVSHSCNIRNSGNWCTNTSGVKGIYLCKDSGKYYAQVKYLGRNKCLGYFDNFDEAVCHRLAADQCLGHVLCEVNSPAYQYVEKMLSSIRR